MINNQLYFWQELYRRWRPAPQLPVAEPAPRRLGLALGGGGGKGTAHLGVLKVLEELDLTPDLIVGTSAGGAVAIFYAAGLSYDEICALFRANAVHRVAALDPTRTGFFGQRKREELLRRLLDDRTFADLPIPCAVVATDLISGREVVIDEGPLVLAVLATTALPGIFAPVVWGDAVLIDGGVLNNLPVSVAERMGAQKVIAVELNHIESDFGLNTALPDNPLARLTLAPQQLTIANRALSLMIAHSIALQLRQHPPALHLCPEVADIALLDTSNPERGRAAGEAAARAASAELLALRAWRHATDERPPTSDAPTPFALPQITLSLPRWPLAIERMPTPKETWRALADRLPPLRGRASDE